MNSQIIGKSGRSADFALAFLRAFNMVGAAFIGALLAISVARADSGVTCACKCKNSAGKNVVLAPDYVSSQDSEHSLDQPSNPPKSPDAQDDDKLQYEPINDDQPILKQSDQTEEQRDGAKYPPGKALTVSPEPDYETDGYPIGGSLAPEIPAPAPSEHPETAPLTK